MRGWHSLYEILKFPIRVLMFATFILGVGNILTNSAFSAFINIDNEIILLSAEAMMRLGTVILVNFPLIFLIRLVTRRGGSATTIISAFLGYMSYLIITMYFVRSDLPATAYSSILGLSATTVSTAFVQGTVRYPLQTGVIASAVVSFVTLQCFRRSRYHSEYGIFSFISKDVWCVINTIVLSSLAALGITFIWPYIVSAIQDVIAFVSQDTTNPINLTLYGILDRFLSLFNLGAMIRTPFWYGANGGTWISMSGSSIAGDVNIWTNQLAASSISGMSGRFITPYYVINIFGIPGHIWAVYFLQTDTLEKRRNRLFYVLLTVISVFMGNNLPLEMTLFVLSPLLYLIHLGITGILFGIFQSMHIYLGFNYTGTNTVAVTPGTLLEYLTYFRSNTLRMSLITIAVIGAVTFVVYFLVTRIYYKYLALDLFRTGDKDRLINGTVEAVGGIENIKLIHSSASRLILSLYDPTQLNADKLRDMGAVRVYDTKAGYAITYGAASTIVRLGIAGKLRQAARTVKS